MKPMESQFDLARLIFGILFILVLIVATLWIIQPFLLGLTWGGMVVIASWPLFIRLQYYLWNKRFLAVLVVTLALMLLFVIPIGLLINSVVDKGPELVQWSSNLDELTFPELQWLNNIPIVGEQLASGWNNMVADGGRTLLAKIKPYAGQSTKWFVSQVVHVGFFMFHGTLMVIFSALLYYKGEVAGMAIKKFAIRLAGEKGELAITLAAQAIRAVALGVVVTALIQSILGGIGLAIAGIHFATLLTVVMFICGVAQIGTLPVLIPSTIWLFWIGDTNMGIFLLIWSAIVGTMDNLIRPLLIRMGADLPLILILLGVIGGMLAFGMIGLFIGPVVLAVGYRLLSAWINELEHLEQIPRYSLRKKKVTIPAKEAKELK